MVDFQRKRRYGWEDFLEIMRLLRAPGGCPWDAEQTHGSIRRNFLEETCEALDALDRDDPADMCEELGDVLMQAVFHAQIETERGGWFHQFGGLSAPIVIWYHAYYRPGTVTAGFETWIEDSSFNEEHTKARIRYRVNVKKKNRIIAVMDSAREYEVSVNGKTVQWQEHIRGALEIFLEDREGEILIQSAE